MGFTLEFLRIAALDLMHAAPLLLTLSSNINVSH